MTDFILLGMHMNSDSIDDSIEVKTNSVEETQRKRTKPTNLIIYTSDFDFDTDSDSDDSVDSYSFSSRSKHFYNPVVESDKFICRVPAPDEEIDTDSESDEEDEEDSDYSKLSDESDYTFFF